MGYYINTNTVKNKSKVLINEYQAEPVSKPSQLSEIPSNKALICVVDNGPFEAAGLVYSQGELEAFTRDNDHRFKEFLTMDKQVAHELSGFRE